MQWTISYCYHSSNSKSNSGHAISTERHYNTMPGIQPDHIYLISHQCHQLQLVSERFRQQHIRHRYNSYSDLGSSIYRRSYSQRNS